MFDGRKGTAKLTSQLVVGHGANQKFLRNGPTPSGVYKRQNAQLAASSRDKSFGPTELARDLRIAGQSQAFVFSRRPGTLLERMDIKFKPPMRDRDCTTVELLRNLRIWHFTE